MTDETTDEQSGDNAPAEAPPNERTGHGDRDDSGRTDDEAPLSGLADRIDARRTTADATADERDALFEEVRVTELESSEVWASLAQDDPDGDDGVGVGAEAEPLDHTAGATDHIIPKSGFCQRCEFFGAPPVLSCDHEGTTIVEVVDSDSFRVRNCPFVEDDD
ncbi:hypothetical protein [Haloferax sp. DFSO52]|uniref:hypothetical protein n=1 Tax=Haloferax sp. DFSO52 TaxID=3388505 RepID=UPI003A8A5E93